MLDEAFNVNFVFCSHSKSMFQSVSLWKLDSTYYISCHLFLAMSLGSTALTVLNGRQYGIVYRMSLSCDKNATRLDSDSRPKFLRRFHLAIRITLFLLFVRLST